MEVPRLGVESELQLPACTTATATPDPSPVCERLYFEKNLSVTLTWTQNSLLVLSKITLREFPSWLSG